MKVSLVLAPMLFRRCPLIGLAYLSSSLKAGGHEVNLFDFNAEAPIPSPDDEAVWQEQAYAEGYIARNTSVLEGWADRILAGDPDIVGFSVWHSNKWVTFALAALIKRGKPDCLVVFGGPHVSFEGRRLLRHCPAADLLVAGEGESALLEITALFGRSGHARGCPGTIYRVEGGIVTAPPRQEIADLDSLPYPDYTGFSLDKYHLSKALPLSFNRGCLRRCRFCNIHADWPSYRHRMAENIYAEMEAALDKYPGLEHFLVDSSALNQDIGQLSRLCERISSGGRRFFWGGMAMLRPEMTPDLLSKMAAAGCRDLSYGLESGSQKVVNLMNKGFLLRHAAQCLKSTHEAGIEVSLNVIVGAPGETEEDFRCTLDFIRANRESIDFIGHPSELILTNGVPMQLYPERFGIEPGPSANGDTWVSGENTHELRLNRVKRFTEFLAGEKIGEFSPQARVRNISK